MATETVVATTIAEDLLVDHLLRDSEAGTTAIVDETDTTIDEAVVTTTNRVTVIALPLVGTVEGAVLGPILPHNATALGVLPEVEVDDTTTVTVIVVATTIEGDTTTEGVHPVLVDTIATEAEIVVVIVAAIVAAIVEAIEEAIAEEIAEEIATFIVEIVIADTALRQEDQHQLRETNLNQINKLQAAQLACF